MKRMRGIYDLKRFREKIAVPTRGGGSDPDLVLTTGSGDKKMSLMYIYLLAQIMIR